VGSTRKRDYSSLDKPATSIKKKQFLAAYAECGIVGKAAEFAEIHRTTHTKWMADDPEYAQQFADAHEDAMDKLEAEVQRRGFEGWEEPVIYQGGLCYPSGKDGKPGKVPLTIRKYDSNLAMFILKGGRPEKFREYWKGELKHSGAVSRGPDLTQLTDEQLEQANTLFLLTTSSSDPTTGVVNGSAAGIGAAGEEPDS
jgi:hypothetical protein